MGEIRKEIQFIKQNEVLGEDVRINKDLHVKKGTRLSAALIQELKAAGCRRLTIEQTAFTHTDHLQKLIHELSEDEQPAKITFKKRLEEHFYTNFTYIGFSYRYGKMITSKEDIIWLKDLYVKILQSASRISLWHMLEEEDPYTFLHALDVFVIGTMLSSHMQLPNPEQFAAGYLLHDIGKLEIPKHILHKNGRLTEEEYALVKKHAVLGEALLIKSGEANISRFARSHHERLGFKGYPDGLDLEAMRTDIQVLAVVDTYSAMTLPRTYREAIPPNEAVQLLLQLKEEYPSRIVRKLMQLMQIQSKLIHESAVSEERLEEWKQSAAENPLYFHNESD